MKIYESGENYLETIFMLEKRKGAVRSIDVATELGFSKPSVSVAMNIFGGKRLYRDGRGRIHHAHGGGQENCRAHL